MLSKALKTQLFIDFVVREGHSICRNYRLCLLYIFFPSLGINHRQRLSIGVLTPLKILWIQHYTNDLI